MSDRQTTDRVRDFIGDADYEKFKIIEDAALEESRHPSLQPRVISLYAANFLLRLIRRLADAKRT